MDPFEHNTSYRQIIGNTEEHKEANSYGLYVPVQTSPAIEILPRVQSEETNRQYDVNIRFRIW